MIASLLRRARPRWRGRRRLVLSLVALVLVAGVAGGWLLLRDGEPAAAATTTTTVATQTLEQSVTASGTVAAATTADLSFGVSGTVTAVYVEPGEKVRKGQRLAAIDDDVLQAELDAADSALDAAKAARSEHLSDGASDEQASADEAAVLAAQSGLAEAQEAVDGAVLRSTTAGTVTAVGIEVGDTTGSSGNPSSESSGDSTDGTITVVKTGAYVVDATVASADVAKVAEGLQAKVTVSGIDDTVFGTVSEVGLVAEADSSGAAVFPVTIEITGRRDDLYAGTSADIAIVVSRRTDVLTVDSRALRTDGDTTYVDKVTDAATGATQRVTVTTGETSGLVTEVLTGLVAGDVVEIPGFTGPGGSGGDEQMQEQMQQFRDRMQQGGGMPPGGFVGVPGGAGQ